MGWLWGGGGFGVCGGGGGGWDLIHVHPYFDTLAPPPFPPGRGLISFENPAHRKSVEASVDRRDLPPKEGRERFGSRVTPSLYR